MSPSEEHAGTEEKPKREHRGDSRGGYGKKPYGGREKGSSGYRGGKKPYDGKRESSHGKGSDDRPRREYRGNGGGRSYGDRPEGDRGHGDGRPYGDRKDNRRSGEKRPYGKSRNDRERKPYGDGPREDRHREDRGSRDDRRGDRKPYGDKRGSHDRRGGDRKRSYGDRRERGSKPRDEIPKGSEEPLTIGKLTIPSDPQKILFKGIDCEQNGRTDLALILYLHGAVAMSGGCEKNAIRMLSDMDPSVFAITRANIAQSCTDDALVEYDYLCWRIDDSYDRSFLDSQYSKGSTHAIYCRILLEEVDGEDPVLDAFASVLPQDEAKIVDGLKFIKRKKDSKKAEELLARNEETKELRQSVRRVFIKALKGEKWAPGRLDELSEQFPEAEFLKGCLESDDLEASLKAGMPEYGRLIISMESDLKLDSAFGKYLRAKRLQADGGDWIQNMINAAVAGSDEALEELRSVQTRSDVRKAFATVYLDRGDLEGLVRMYDGEDARYLEQYCGFDAQRIIEAGRLMNSEREIDWLKRNYRKGVEECRAAIEAMADDESRRSKLLVYALHDVGSDMKAAELYFAMEGNPSLPSYKWLSKVCGEEEVKEYVRSQFEKKGDLETFESIFVDDGYVKKGKGPSRGGKGPSRKRYRSLPAVDQEESGVHHHGHRAEVVDYRAGDGREHGHHRQGDGDEVPAHGEGDVRPHLGHHPAGDSDEMRESLETVLHQDHVRCVRRDVRAGGAHGDADPRPLQGGCVVDAVPDHAYLAASGLDLLDGRDLVLGGAFGPEIGYACIGGHGLRSAGVVAREEHAVHAHALQLVHRGAGGLADRIRECDVSGVGAVYRDECHRGARVVQDVGTLQGIGWHIHSEGSHEPPVPYDHVTAVLRGPDAVAGGHGEGIGFPVGDPVPLRVIEECLREGMAGTGLRGRREGGHAVGVADRGELHHAGPPDGDRACLVERNSAYLGHPLQGVPVAHQNPALREVPYRCHHGGRGGEYERAGAEHDHHCDGAVDVLRERVCGESQNEDDRHEPGGPHVGGPHHAGLLRIRRGYHVDHPLERRIAGGLLGHHLERPHLVYGAAVHGIPDGLVLRHGLARDHGLIYGRLP